MMDSNEAVKVDTGLSVFFQKNRKSLFITLIAVAAALLCAVAALYFYDLAQRKAIVRLEEYGERYEKIKAAFDGPSGADEDESAALLAELSHFASRASGYAAARAWFMAADMYHARKDWQKAGEAWLAASVKGAKTHLAPVCLFNAAVTEEEYGDTDAAIANYTKCLGFSDFPAASHAQFSVGRLEEQRGNREAALEAYRKVIENWPEESDWTNLAHSRIISLGL